MSEDLTGVALRKEGFAAHIHEKHPELGRTKTSIYGQVRPTVQEAKADYEQFLALRHERGLDEALSLATQSWGLKRSCLK